MPRISYFRGIGIYMYYRDHGPPHFHARHAGRRGRFALDGRLLAGDLDRPQQRLVRKWARLHQRELEFCWDRVSRDQDPGTIEPLP